MTQLVLTRKPILADLGRWLGADTEGTVVVTSAGPDRPDGPDGGAERRFLHVHRFEDYSAPDAGARIVELARRFAATRIASLNEVDVLRAAAARQLLGLPGQDIAGAVAFRDKYVMKSLVSAAGVPVAPMRRVPCAPRGAIAAGRLRYPLVVKPIAGGGSVGVQVLTDPRQWEGVTTPGPLLVEEMVDEASFYIVDGLMKHGRATLPVPLQMGSGNFTYATGDQPVAGYSLPRDGGLFTELTVFCDEVLRILPPVTEETAFHMEIFRDRAGRLLLCEVACRPGGMGHPSTFRTVTGVDLNEASLLGQLGRPRPGTGDERLQEGGFAGFPRRDGVLVRHPDRLTHPHVMSYTALVAAGEYTTRSRWVGDDAAQLTLKAPAGMAMGDVMAEVVAEYRSLTEWA
ncbi:hypothetical protein AB0B78_01135 [Streptomyces sp. NPDC040724]|uniref:ATP-grasp domain-containing protein n=1 Tax=Streptomyces sp. NPDC040724 TaxID=3155612 RepID=UPI0033D3F3F4